MGQGHINRCPVCLNKKLRRKSATLLWCPQCGTRLEITRKGLLTTPHCFQPNEDWEAIK
jgi:ribosomal protein L37AE/L43A